MTWQPPSYRKFFPRRVSTVVAILIASVFAQLALMPEAECRRRRWRPRRPPVINEKRLHERIGGLVVLRQIVDEWVRAAMADSRVASSFGPLVKDPAALTRLRAWLYDQTCELADGPCTPANLGGVEQRAWESQGDTEFLVLMDQLLLVLERRKTGLREQNELIARWGQLERQPTLGPAESQQ